MDVIGHDVAFQDLALFLTCQFVEDRPELLSDLPKQLLASPFGHAHDMVFAIPLGVGQALVILVHQVLLWCGLIKPPKGELTPGTLKAVQVALVEPVAYPL